MSHDLVAIAGPDTPLPMAPEIHLRRYTRQSRIAAFCLLAIAFLLGVVVQLTSAVVAYGDVTVDSKVKKISHPTGGVIAKINVRDGDKVRRGQVLLQFDTAVSGVSAVVSGKNLDQLLAMQARLTAEREGLPSIIFPAELVTHASQSASVAMAEEQRLFRLKRDGREGQRSELRQRIAQDEQEIVSYHTQAAADRQQVVIIQPELQGMRQLYAKGLSPLNRVNELERTAVSLTASAAALDAQIAQARAQISEIRQQMLQLDQDARSQAGTELADVTARLADQQVRNATASDALDRSAVRAPQSGTVDKLAFTTIGGVVPPAQEILEIVPDNDRLTVEAKVSPTDINQLHLGQYTELRFTAFNVRTTPQVMGILHHISAERQTDEKTGTSYYAVLIDIGPDQLNRLGGLALVPGMPVEAYVQTGRRSMLSYLLKPLTDQFARSFRQN